MFPILLEHLRVAGSGPGRPRTRPEKVRGDKAYSSKAIRELLRSRSITAVIPQPADQIGHRKRRGSSGGRPPSFDADPAPGQLVGDEPVPESRVIGVDVTGGVDQVRVVPITLRYRCFAPFVERLGGEPKDPAGHRDGHAVIGKVEDQRVHHFGLASRDR